MTKQKNDAKVPKVRCHECVYARNYWPMYVGDDPRKWGTSVCTRTARRKRVDTLSGYQGCDKGVRKPKAKANGKGGAK